MEMSSQMFSGASQKLFGTLEQDKFTELFQRCFRASSSSSTEDVLKFASENNLDESSVNLVISDVLQLINYSVKRNWSSADLEKECIKSGLKEEMAAVIRHQWEENCSALTKAALLRSFNSNQLVDLEWKFGITAASSELSKIANTFIQLKLVIAKQGKRENVFMELSLPQFYSLLHEMEKAKASLEQQT